MLLQDVGDDGELALGLGHDVLENQLALFLGLVDALAGGAANVQALDALLHEPAGQSADSIGVDATLGIVAGIEGGDNTLVFLDISHIFSPY